MVGPGTNFAVYFITVALIGLQSPHEGSARTAKGYLSSDKVKSVCMKMAEFVASNKIPAVHKTRPGNISKEGEECFYYKWYDCGDQEGCQRFLKIPCFSPPAPKGMTPGKKGNCEDPAINVPQACCTLPPIESQDGYQPKGKMIKIDSLDCYETGDESSTNLLVHIHDIWGFNPKFNQGQQFSDKLSAGGWRVVAPDFYHGEPWDPKDWPLTSESKPRFEEWVNKRGNWDKTVKHDMQCAINHYLGQKVVKNIAVYGFCWGGLMAIRSAQDSSLPVKAGGLVHPARWTMDDAQTVKKPLVIMPSMNENDMEPFCETVKKNVAVEDACVHHRFNDMMHGFAGHRGNYSNTLIMHRVNEVLDMLNKFFLKHLGMKDGQ